MSAADSDRSARAIERIAESLERAEKRRAARALADLVRRIKREDAKKDPERA